MAKRSKRPSGGLGLGKVITIGILSVVLLLVIVTQFGRRKERAAHPAARHTASENSAEASSSAPPAAAATIPRAENHWPTFNVAEVVASNPFLLPEVLRPRREVTKTLTPNLHSGEAEENIGAIESAEVREMRRRQAEFLTSLRAKGVDMILRSPHGSIARIGDLSLRVGDLHEGLRVEAITQNGVIFAPAVVTGGQLD